MKLKYEAKKGTRINYGFIGCTTFEKAWWYNETLKKWEYDPDMSKGYDYSSYALCKSTKAFIRKLKKAPKGVEFILCSVWKSNNITGFGKNIQALTH
jgi:hypothetical protein